jgi:PleD family two-component response regulator
VIAHRLEDYISDSGRIGRDQIDDLQKFIDKMQDVLRKKPDDKSVDAKEVVRSLPVKASFDPRAVSNTNVEIMLVMPKGAGARFVEKELRGCGYRVNNVPAPFMAFEMALITRPDMIIASAVLADLDGIDLACAFRAMPKTQQIPFAIITSLSLDDGSLNALPKDLPIIRKGANFGEDLARTLDFLGIT